MGWQQGSVMPPEAFAEMNGFEWDERSTNREAKAPRRGTVRAEVECEPGRERETAEWVRTALQPYGIRVSFYGLEGR